MTIHNSFTDKSLAEEEIRIPETAQIHVLWPFMKGWIYLDNMLYLF